MTNRVRIPIGKLAIDTDWWFDVQQRDDGIHLSFCDRRTNSKTTVIINGKGAASCALIGSLSRTKRATASRSANSTPGHSENENPKKTDVGDQNGVIELTAIGRKVLLTERGCPFCQSPFKEPDVTAAGVRRDIDGATYYWFETQCNRCIKKSSTIVTSCPMDMKGLFKVLEPLYGSRKIGRETNSPRTRSAGTPPPLPAQSKRGPAIEDRCPTPMHLRVVDLLDCTPGNAKHPNGEPITILSLACNDEVEQPLSLTLKDTRTLAARCFVSLATHGDEFAGAMCDRYLRFDQKSGASWLSDK